MATTMRRKKGSPASGGKAARGDARKIAAIIARYGRARGALIPVLQEAQAALGYLSKETIARIAEGLSVPTSQVHGVATFYTQFRLRPAGKHLIRVCHGTACHVGGAAGISEAIEEALGVKDGQTTPDGKFTLESVACLGCCSLAPVMMIDGETYGRLTKESAVKALKEF